MIEFKWNPGQGIDAGCLARLRDHFPKPREPMGESWFMGERRMFPELLGDLDRLDIDAIRYALNEIPAGISAFGPRDEWRDWYHYLLGALLPRAHEGRLVPTIESLVTGFMAIHPNGVHSAPYKTFREDVLLTLGRCLMEPECWNGREVAVGALLHRSNRNPAGIWGWWNASGDFSASMFFCLKYLPEPLVAGWLRSVLATPSPQWRAQLIVWAVGAHPFLAGKKRWPAEMQREDRPAIDWEWSHCLREELAVRDDSGATPVGALLPDAAREDAVRVIRSHFNVDIFLEWLESFSTIPDLSNELAEIPSTFEELYLR